ncbi:MAG: ankyrin repeat domain-containing protein [Cyanobacteria bacterium P01_E01_bin.42]
MSQAVKSNDIEQVNFLLATECIESQIIDLALLKASSYGHVRVVQLLINYDANVNHIFGSGTALTEAIDNEYIDIIDILLDKGADCNLPFYGEVYPPLFIAIAKGNLEIVKKLIKVGANVNPIRDESIYALEYAASEGYKDIFDFLYPLTDSELHPEALEALPKGMQMRQIEDEADPLVCQLTSAIIKRNIDTVRKLLTVGVNVNEFDDIGTTALNCAVIERSVELVQLILESGGDPNLGNADDEVTPLMNLGRIGGWDEATVTICSLLLKAGANVNAGDEEGWTPLMFAVNSPARMEITRIGRLQGVRQLLEAGAEVNTQNTERMTAIMLAAQFGNVQIIRILIEAKAEINLKDREGKTALDYACEQFHKKYALAEGNNYNEAIKILRDADQLVK